MLVTRKRKQKCGKRGLQRLLKLLPLPLKLHWHVFGIEIG